MVIDSSTSMSGFKLKQCKQKLIEITGGLRPNDYVTICTFNHQKPVVVIQGLINVIKRDIAARVNAMKAQGGTALWDAVVETVAAAKAHKSKYDHTLMAARGKPARRCKLIVLTDGCDEHSTQSFSTAKNIVSKPGFVMEFIMIGIGIGTSTQNQLKDLCSAVHAKCKCGDASTGIAEAFHWIKKDIIQEVVSRETFYKPVVVTKTKKSVKKGQKLFCRR